MAYLGDPRENSIDLNDHAIWESDNRVEERYLWNGSVIDLCDLPVEEYMKNPIIEAIENSGGGSSQEVLDALSEDTDIIRSAISSSTEVIIETLSGGSEPTKAIPFYYTAKNHNTPIGNLTINDFESASTHLYEETEFVFVIEDPRQEDYEAYLNDKDEAKYREASYNTLYVLVPTQYINGVVLKDIMTTVEFTPVASSILDGFSLLEYDNINTINSRYPDVKNITYNYTIKIRK